MSDSIWILKYVPKTLKFFSSLFCFLCFHKTALGHVRIKESFIQYIAYFDLTEEKEALVQCGL